MLADAYEQAGYVDEAAAFRAGDWTCHDHPALVAMIIFGQAERDDALEQAAKVADNLGGNRADASRPDHDRGDAVIRAMQVRAKTIATAIRALKGVEG